jgi:hypothetical protein
MTKARLLCVLCFFGDEPMSSLGLVCGTIFYWKRK